MMKRFILFLTFLLTGFAVFSQPYNNEWIDFSKVYYKFKVGKTGLYRIPQTTLAAAGLGGISADQFRLIRNGEEVPVYITAATGPISNGGYIEFWGEANDGKADKPLYRDPAFQHTDKISLQTDTAAYFLTVVASSNRRLTEQPNDVSNSTLPTEPYFMYTAGNYYRARINPGFSRNAGEYVYSSSYDRGEYWSSAELKPGALLSGSLTSLAVYTGGPAASFRFGASGNAQNNRTVVAKVNNSELFRGAMNIFQDLNTGPISFPVSLISGGTADVTFTNTSDNVNDRMVVSYYEITYPRKFDFGGSRNFTFELPAKPEGYQISVTNFVRGTERPVLYDLTNGHRFSAVYSATGDSLKFLLPPGFGARKLVLVNEEASNINTVTTLVPRQFVNYLDPANQGDYIIISNPILYNGANGTNPVFAYRDYRKSMAGGNYNAVVVDINDLVDQFAFGIKKHPLSVKNFIRYARDKFGMALKDIFLIGRGMDYVNYRNNQANVLADQLNLVPTFGYPGSDNFLSSANSLSAVPVVPIGRLSVVHAFEIENYLQKIIEYENAQRSAANTVDSRLWMKNVIHVTGASQSELGVTLCNFMDGYKDMLEDTLTGADVHLFCKSSANPVEQLSSNQVADLFEEGLSLVTYFGHSSTTTLEFNIDNPENYNNLGKYPIFSVNGCNAGNFFTFYAQRLEVNETLSEKFVLAKQRGGIAFLASTHFGIVNYLNIYLNELYKNFSDRLYGHTLGEINKGALDLLLKSFANEDFFARCHSEEITLHGDPAIRMNFQEKPDYVIEDPLIKISPSFVSIAESNFNLTLKMFNLGKAVDDSIMLEVKRQYPDGSVDTLYRERRKAILYADSLSFTVPVISTRDKGANKIIVTLDADNDIEEMDESNNTVTREFYVYEDEARPAFPYNYSIVDDPNQKLYASTANPLGTLKTYTVEIDTTLLFNSSVKKSGQISLSGGIIEFDPHLTYQNNTVYYWRIGVPVMGGEMKWNTSSFMYESDRNGFGQAHYYQFADNQFTDIKYEEGRKLSFNERSTSFNIHTGVYPYASVTSNFSLNYGNSFQAGLYSPFAVNSNCLRFYVIDGKTLLPWVNQVTGSTGLYGSYAPTPINETVVPGFFHFDVSTATNRKKVMDFLDLIPEGDYVVVTNPPADAAILPSVWLNDTTLYGSGISLYHKMKEKGFTQIDELTSHVPFVFVYQQGKNKAIRQLVSKSIAELVNISFDAFTSMYTGQMTSKTFGPAKKWKTLYLKGSPANEVLGDSARVEVLGINNNGGEDLLTTVKYPFGDPVSLEWIDAKIYPSLKLRLFTLDSLNYTPFQLDSWMVAGEFVPEGALLPPTSIALAKDTLEVGEKLLFNVAFKNISTTAFDSVGIRTQIIDNVNSTRTVDKVPTKGKPLLSNDTIFMQYEIDTKDFAGSNTLFVDFNPDNEQPEQYHYNNFIYKDFYVKPDNLNPLLDVTFDGAHILNRDIVSSKPHIRIKVKDEAKYMLLNDTSVIVQLQVRYPDNTYRTYKFDGDTLRFTPATDGMDNTATIDFTPYFPTLVDANNQPLYPDGDDYELTVMAKDRSGNRAGNMEYKVTFRVIDKPMISNLLNYPNPFTTSTAFVFTITGSEIPQNIKIQILTVTGKVVREITKEELGTLRIGRNITEFKWNGTDQYGQRLGNGVYLYRVVTTLNGRRMDKYKSENDDTDKYFNRGYGKMYLMR